MITVPTVSGMVHPAVTAVTVVTVVRHGGVVAGVLAVGVRCRRGLTIRCHDPKVIPLGGIRKVVWNTTSESRRTTAEPSAHYRDRMSIDPKFEKVFTAGSLANLATIKRDGRPQLSVVSYHYDPATATFRISVTADRAKTANLRRDPRASLLVGGANRWQYAVAEGTAQLGEVAREPNDAAADELVDLFRTLAGEHPDWDEFREAMVEEGRLVLRVVADRAYGAAG